MEMLQSIWTALTTENEGLIIPISIVFSLVESYIWMLIFTTILDIKATRKQRIIYIFILTLTSFITKYLIPNPYNAFFNVIIVIVSSLKIFKINILKVILGLLIPMILPAIIESIFSKIYYSIFNIEYIVGLNIPLHRIIGSIIIYSFMYVVYYILKLFKLNFKNIEILNSKKKFVLILDAVFGVIFIATQIYVIYFYANLLPFFIIIINIMSLLTYFLISLYTIYTVSKLESTAMDLQEAQLHNKTLELLQDNTRAFRHDFGNILQGMMGYIDRNDIEGLKKYYSQLLSDFQNTNNLATLSPEVVNNPAVYNVLATKYHKADSLGIKINLESFLDMNSIHMKIYEFTRVLGILLDNAIEATSECDNKIVNIIFRKDTAHNRDLLIIENTYIDKNVDTEKIYEKGYTSKAEKGNTGLGLWEVRQILKKSDNLNLFTSKDAEFFKQQFEIYYS